MPNTTDSQPEHFYTRKHSFMGKKKSCSQLTGEGEGGNLVWFKTSGEARIGRGERVMRLKEYTHLLGKVCRRVLFCCSCCFDTVYGAAPHLSLNHSSLLTLPNSLILYLYIVPSLSPRKIKG